MPQDEPRTGRLTRASTPPADTSGETTAQANARSKAEDYLSFASFSRSGLIGQLEFDGFTNAQATYGVSQTGL